MTGYAFLLLAFLPTEPVTLLSAPVVSAAASASRVSVSTFRNSDAAVEGGGTAAAARLGSAWAISGTVVASMIWKGSETKCPCTSNHSVNERANSILRAGPLFGVTSTTTQ